jgi:PAS domain S-box-containing protein
VTNRPSTLIVDDDCDLRFALIALLEAEGHVVIEAEHGRHAFDQLAANAPQLIILDLTMPVMDGRTFLEEKAKSSHAGIPVIVFSSAAHSQVESMPGVVAIVHKLAGVEALLAAIKRMAADDAKKPSASAGGARRPPCAETLSPLEAEVRQFVDAMPQLAWIARPDGYISWYNARWYEYTGTTLEQAEGWGWHSVHDPEGLPAIMHRWRLSIATQRPFDMTLPLRRADGRFRRFLIQVTPVRDPKTGDLIRWVGTNTDVDDREELLTLAAHELRTPMTSLLLRLQLMRRKLSEALTPAGAGQLSESLNVALVQAARVGHLLTDVLGMSQIRSRGRAEERMPLDLGELAKKVVVEHRSDPADPWRCIDVVVDKIALVEGERVQLEQMVTSLLTNAVKFGGGKPIRVSVTATDDNAELRVEDEGMGIEPAHQARIFERFERLVSSRSHGGLGLGLYVAREIARAHAGNIAVASTPGKGSVFTATIPLHHS